MQPAVAFLARGSLFLKIDDQPPRDIQSAFAQGVLDRQARAQEVDGWKANSGAWGEMGMASPELAQWQMADQRRQVLFKSVTAGDDPNQLYYLLGVGDMGGLFQYTIPEDLERRLMHKNGFAAKDLSRRKGTGEMAISVARENGTTGILVGENDGRFLQDRTTGDSIDESPSWVEGDACRLVYQSAGIGRDENGYAVGLSPYRIETLDLDKKSIDTLLEEDHVDLLQPKHTTDGTLYFIRRPYQPQGREQPSAMAVLKDILLFPFRLGRAVFHFLDFFSMMFSGKPLTSAGGPQRKLNDQRYIMLWGRMIDTKQAMQKSQKQDSKSLVPKEWELVKRTPEGEETVLAERVLSFDVAENGKIVYTDGTVVFSRDEQGNVSEICSDRLIEKVILVQ